MNNIPAVYFGQWEMKSVPRIGESFEVFEDGPSARVKDVFWERKKARILLSSNISAFVLAEEKRRKGETK